MSYRITRIVGVRNDIEVVRLSCNKKTKLSLKEYNMKLLNFYDANGVKLDYIELESELILKGQKGGRRKIIPDKELTAFIEANPTMNKSAISRHFGVHKTTIGTNLKRIKDENKREF